MRIVCSFGREKDVVGGATFVVCASEELYFIAYSMVDEVS